MTSSPDVEQDPGRGRREQVDGARTADAGTDGFTERFGPGSVRELTLATNGSATAPSSPPADTEAARPETSLDPRSLLRHQRPVPKRGWRHFAVATTRGRVNPGLSSKEAGWEALLAQVRTPVRRCTRVAVISLKGGVGKTTTTAGLGATLATIRGDRIIAVDANPDAGTLASRFPRESDATVRDVLDHLHELRSYGAVRAFTSQGPSRLEVIASDQDPAVSTAFSEDDYRAVTELLALYYSVVLTDSGTGLLHSAMQGILDLADSLVIVTSPSVDGAKGANDTLDWLVAHDYGELVERSIAVVSTVRRQSHEVDMRKLEAHFARRCQRVVRIPYDQHLQTGAAIDLDQLRPATRRAYLELAAHVAGEFASYPIGSD